MTHSRAFVVHLTPHRIRIKIPRWERHNARFATLQRALEERPDVVYVQVNALVASIVIHCRDGFEIASVGDCVIGLELVLPTPGSAGSPWTRQIAPPQRVRGRSTGSSYLVSLVVNLTIAIVTRRFEALIRGLILEAAVQVLVRQLYRQPTPSLRLAAPRALVVAAA